MNSENNTFNNTEIDIENEDIIEEDTELQEDSNADMFANQSGIKSKERVREHGEVYTPEHIVKDMLNLNGIKEMSYEIDKTFLEPSCGNGNFLVEIIRRKLDVAKREALIDGVLDKEKYNINIVRVICSIYGVDIMGDNIQQARQRMMSIAKDEYSKTTGEVMSKRLEKVLGFIMSRNIILGDMLKNISVEYNMFNDKGNENIPPVDQVTPDMGEYGKNKMMFYEWYFNGNKVSRGVFLASDMADSSEYSGNRNKEVNYMNISELYFNEDEAEELDF